MEPQLILGIVNALLLISVIVIMLTGRKKTELGAVISLLKKTEEAQRERIARQLSEGATEQFRRFGLIQDSVQATLQGSREELDRRLSAMQEQTLGMLKSNREETIHRLEVFQSRIDSRLSSIQTGNGESIDRINATLETRMKTLQESNERRLEQMQGVVDEKLQKTLEARLVQSFSLVSRQLDSVQQGLGEMRSLAADARSLKNALTNVKERGTYGEVRLERLLADILAPGQYETNVEIGGGKRVEFVIKLPGNGETPLLLPIDSKFPIEDYSRLLDAEDKRTMDEARKALLLKVRSFASDIHDKYILPPKTTDFALMFLPTEGLYAEVVQNAALFEELRDRYKVTAVGATTLSAFLSSLQMGFKTLAIEQRSQEVWDTLRSVKKQFGEFETLLNQAHKQLQTVDHTIEKLVGTRTRAINRALRHVEQPGDLFGTKGTQPGDSLGTSAERPEDSFGTPAERPEDSSGTPGRMPGE